MILRSMVILLLTFSAFSWGDGCNVNDAMIFSCRMSDSSFYICFGENKAYYKPFKKGINDFVYPKNEVPGIFTFSSNGYSGGGETRIEFKQGKYLYSIYDRVIKSEANGEKYPDFESGMEIIKNNIEISKEECLSSSGVNQSLAKKVFRLISH